MKTVRTCELIGPALNLSVARARGNKMNNAILLRFYNPSENWEQGGPLIEQYKLTIHQINGICATINDDTNEPDYDGRLMRSADGDTVLIAACRVIVAAKLGDTVQIPDELWTAQNDTAPTSRPDSKDAGAAN